MSLMCAYQNCLCTKFPCGSIAFFRLPSDSRRGTWIKNSGNKALINISDKANRFFCENHFQEGDIRTQFNRKILRKHAVPIEFEPSQPGPKKPRLHECSENDEEQKCETNLVIEKIIVGANNSEFLEDMVIMPYEKQENDDTTEKHFEDTFNIIDYHLSTESYGLSLQHEEHTVKDEQPENNCGKVDSSTIDLDESFISNEQEIASSQNEVEVLESKSNEIMEVTTSNNDYEEDKHFALSLVGYFQRLPKNRKALAKLKILQYLTDLDIGWSANL